MKVLSLKQPYASLIKEKKKTIETRSFKTNYRGELYIHASASAIPKQIKNNLTLMNLLKDKDFKYGHIICKCQLVDCIYMDEKFIEKIKQNLVEYLCGDYQVGRYAWVLQDIEPLRDPIKVKGKLNIWNFDIEETK